MLYRLILRNGHVTTPAAPRIESPNAHGGTGDCVVTDAQFWTGDVWLYGDFAFGAGAIRKVETRSTLDETDEVWADYWAAPPQFHYGAYHVLARKLAGESTSPAGS